MPVIVEGVDCIEQGGDAVGDGAVEYPSASDAGLYESRGKPNERFF